MCRCPTTTPQRSGGQRAVVCGSQKSCTAAERHAAAAARAAAVWLWCCAHHSSIPPLSFSVWHCCAFPNNCWRCVPVKQQCRRGMDYHPKMIPPYHSQHCCEKNGWPDMGINEGQATTPPLACEQLDPNGKAVCCDSTEKPCECGWRLGVAGGCVYNTPPSHHHHHRACITEEATCVWMSCLVLSPPRGARRL